MVVFFGFVEVECECCCGWFVDDLFDFEVCDVVGVFGCLVLVVVEVCWYCDYGFCDWFVEVVFGGFFYFV